MILEKKIYFEFFNADFIKISFASFNFVNFEKLIFEMFKINQN